MCSEENMCVQHGMAVDIRLANVHLRSLDLFEVQMSIFGLQNSVRKIKIIKIQDLFHPSGPECKVSSLVFIVVFPFIPRSFSGFL